MKRKVWWLRRPRPWGPRYRSRYLRREGHVEDGETGLWFRGGDEDDLLDKMRTIQSSNDRVTMLGRAAYNRYWKDPYTMTRHLEQLETAMRQ